MSCPDCGGCTDDRCTGCSERWCGGAYMGEGCDRCPEKVDKPITVKKMRGRSAYDEEITIRVRCNSSRGAGHPGIHHWDPWKAGGLF
jgi:hypothetical protein